MLTKAEQGSADRISTSTRAKRRTSTGRKLRAWFVYDLLNEQEKAEAELKPRKRRKRTLRQLGNHVAWLGHDLWEIDRTFGEGGLTPRQASRYALKRLLSFLVRQDVYSHVLQHLEADLRELDRGITPLTLKAKRKNAGRKIAS